MLPLAGPAYAHGLRHGRTLRTEIARLVDCWSSELQRCTQCPSNEVIGGSLCVTGFLPAITRHAPALIEDVSDLADGSGQPFERMLAYQLLDMMWVHLDRPHGGHCSSIGVLPPLGGRRPAFVAQNMDVESFRDDHQVVLHIAAGGPEPEQLIFTCAGFLVMAGVNA